jgi:phosphatidylinositol glycan class M
MQDTKAVQTHHTPKTYLQTMTWFQRLISFPAILTISALIRTGLVIYAEWHDARSVLKYTDVDYRVFSDATRYILRLDGGPANVAKGPLGPLVGFGE